MDENVRSAAASKVRGYALLAAATIAVGFGFGRHVPVARATSCDLSVSESAELTLVQLSSVSGGDVDAERGGWETQGRLRLASHHEYAGRVAISGEDYSSPGYREIAFVVEE